MADTSIYRDKIDNLGTLDASGANTIVFAPGRQAVVRKIILITTVAQTVANATITVAVRDVDNGNSVTQGTFVMPFATSATDDVAFVKPGQPATAGTTAVDGSLVFEGYEPGGGIVVEPGQELALTSDGGGDAGTYQVYVESIDNPFVEAEADREITFVAA